MANTSSAKKALKQNSKARLRNKSKINEVRTYSKKVELDIKSGKIDDAMTSLKTFEKFGMKAVSKKLFHISTISRKISKLYALINKSKAK